MVFWEGLLKNRYFGGSTEKIGIWGSTEKKIAWQQGGQLAGTREVDFQ